MQAPGSMKYISSSSLEAIHLTGQTSIQDLSLTPIQGSVITKGKVSSIYKRVAQKVRPRVCYMAVISLTVFNMGF
jgi:hypothetical protein